MVSESSLILNNIRLARKYFDYKPVKTVCLSRSEQAGRDVPRLRWSQCGSEDVQQKTCEKETGAETSRMNRLSY